jgi:hypothetical protein
MLTIQSARLLKLALCIDAAGSAALGIMQLALPTQLGQTLQLPLPLLQESGLFCVAYALLLLALASRRQLPLWTIQVIIVGNIGWALACLVLAAAPVLAPSGAGMAYLAFQAIAVLLFAALEYAGLKASAPQAAAGALHFQ